MCKNRWWGAGNLELALWPAYLGWEGGKKYLDMWCLHLLVLVRAYIGACTCACTWLTCDVALLLLLLFSLLLFSQLVVVVILAVLTC